MKKVIIAGACGYVGGNLIRALDGRAEITRVDLAEGCLSPDDLGKLEGAYDVFYNLAWRGKGGPARADCALQTQNVLTAMAFYETALRLGCTRYICAGTIGELMVQLPECAKIRSQNFVYIHAKNYLHSLLRNKERPEACRVVWARLGNLYGGGNSGGNLVDYAVGCLRANEPAVFGPAEQPYDFVHAEDAARALAALGLAENLESDEFYVGSGDVRPLRDYLWTIGRICQRESLVRIGGRPDDGTRYRADWFSIDALVRETGYRPQIDFACGVARLIEEERA